MSKVSKASVNYRDAGPDAARRCGNCAMFHAATGSCDLVAGSISSGDVCDRWVAVKSPKMAPPPSGPHSNAGGYR